MARANFQKYFPDVSESYDAIDRLTDFTIPKKQLQNIGSRAAKEASTMTKGQETQLENLRRSLRQQRKSAINQVSAQRSQLPRQFNNALQSAIADANAAQGQRGAVAGSGLHIRNILAGGSQALTQNASNLGQIANQQAQIEQSFLQNLVQNVMQPRNQLAQSQGQGASEKYYDYINQAKQAIYQGHVQKADQLLTKAQREYNKNIIATQNSFQSWLQNQQGKVTQAQMNVIKEIQKYDSTPASGNVNQWLTKAIKLTGVPMSWLPGLKLIAMHESGGNPRAVNDWDINAKRGTPSKGLMQTIGPTFNAHKLPGHGNILNPVDNAIAAIRYIKSRYGDITNVPGVESIRNGGEYRPY